MKKERQGKASPRAERVKTKTIVVEVRSSEKHRQQLKTAKLNVCHL